MKYVPDYTVVKSYQNSESYACAYGQIIQQLHFLLLLI